jgi:hypothetical protein
MLVESGHVAEDGAFVFEEGAAPLDGLVDARAGFVDELADVLEDGLREGLRLVDVGVDFGVEVIELVQSFRSGQRRGGHSLELLFVLDSSLHVEIVGFQKYSLSAAKLVSSRNCWPAGAGLRCSCSRTQVLG